MAIAVLGAVSANAQWYVGGSVGFGISNDEADADGLETEKTIGFSLIPEIGYSVNEKLDAGISLGFSTAKTDNVGYADGVESKTNSWEVAPYVRYSVVEFGKFSILAKGSIFVNGGKTEVNNDENKFTAFGLNVKPVLAFNLSEKFSLLADLNFAGLEFSRTDNKDRNTVTNFGFGIDTNNVANTGDILIGFAYKF